MIYDKLTPLSQSGGLGENLFIWGFESLVNLKGYKAKKDAEKAFGVFESLANFVRTRNNINPRFVSIRKLCPLCFET